MNISSSKGTKGTFAFAKVVNKNNAQQSGELH